MNFIIKANHDKPVSPDGVLGRAEEAYKLLANRYHPKPYPGKTLVFHTQDGNNLAAYLTGDVEEYIFDTHHYGFKEDVAIMNEWFKIINRGLEEASQGHTSRASNEW
jgi:hypothetical protein